jgi:uridine kinase
MTHDSEYLNKQIADGRFQQLVYKNEELHQEQIEKILSMIKKKWEPMGEVCDHAILITGPSSSGKTTFAGRLRNLIRCLGYSCNTVSFDDYYLNKDEIHKRQAGVKSFDYETIEAFDLDYFHEQMNDYIENKPIELPKYDFITGERVKSNNFITGGSKDVLIVEGIHGLNPALTNGVNFTSVFKIYISPQDIYTVRNLPRTVKPQDIRFMRRTLRDIGHRNANIEKTMEMWPDVRKGEEKYIKPMKTYADFIFNSSLEYEIAYLKEKIFNIVKKLTPKTVAQLKDILPLEVLRRFEGYDKAIIPDDSIFNEFLLNE